MSMPRAAMSVATSTRISPFLKPASACVRAVWLLLPWIAIGADAVPAPATRARRLAPCLVRGEHQHLAPVVRLDEVRQQLALAGRGRPGGRICVMQLDGGVARRDLDRAPGRAAGCRPELADLVARRWPRTAGSGASSGSSARMRFMSGMKPMSSMRSASSSTRICDLAQVHACFCCTWSSRRPGRGDQDVDAARSSLDLRVACRRRRRSRSDVSCRYLP